VASRRKFGRDDRTPGARGPPAFCLIEEESLLVGVAHGTGNAPLGVSPPPDIDIVANSDGSTTVTCPDITVRADDCDMQLEVLHVYSSNSTIGDGLAQVEVSSGVTGTHGTVKHSFTLRAGEPVPAAVYTRAPGARSRRRRTPKVAANRATWSRAGTGTVDSHGRLRGRSAALGRCRLAWAGSRDWCRVGATSCGSLCLTADPAAAWARAAVGWPSRGSWRAQASSVEPIVGRRRRHRAGSRFRLSRLRRRVAQRVAKNRAESPADILSELLASISFFLVILIFFL
jgi:hypothetical protein